MTERELDNKIDTRKRDKDMLNKEHIIDCTVGVLTSQRDRNGPKYVTNSLTPAVTIGELWK